jgi:transportin-1
VVQQGGLLRWPNLLAELLELVSNTSGQVPPDAQEGAMSALSKVCEDNRKILDREYDGQRPMIVIIPKLLDFTAHSNTKIRLYALKTLKALIPQKSQTLLSALDVYLARIFQLATDPSSEIRRVICQSLVQLVDARPNMLAPHLEGLVAYIIAQQQSQNDPELALDAAEFWLGVGEQDQLRVLMGPYLEKVIPVLLQGMIYGEDDIIRLGGDEDNADKEDRAEDLKPQFAQAKAGRIAAGSTNSGVLVNGNNHSASINGANEMEEGELSEGEIEDEEGDDWEDDDPEDQWTLRKCSAAALDIFAVNFHQPVFEIIFPYLKENLNAQEWPKREAAVLALGAVAEGCMLVVAPNLPELVPYLISLLSDPEPAVRQITCWCLGRYSEWASHLESPADRSQYFVPMMEGLLEHMLDRNKKVQEAAASAFASLEEKSAHRILPYTEPILRQFVQCFLKYKDKNMYILYDCVQTLADNVTSELAKPNLVNLLMPVLMERWNKVADESREMFPLLGCLGYVAAAYGDTFSAFAEPIFQRCVKIIHDNLNATAAVRKGQAVDEPDTDFIVTSLDLISSIIQAIDPLKSGHLVGQLDFFKYLTLCMEEPSTDIRQSAYALLGDCAIMVFPQLEPWLPRVAPFLADQLDLDLITDEDSENGFNVLNNVCWSCGELGAKAGAKIAPWIEALYRGLIIIMKTEDVPESVNENAAMALGRLGIGCSEQLASHLPEFADSFLTSMAKITPTQEKASAFLGFNRVIERNPTAMERCLNDYFTAIAMFPKREMAAVEFKQVRQSFGNVSPIRKRQIGTKSETDSTITGDSGVQGVDSRLPVFFLSALNARTTKASQYICIMTGGLCIVIGAMKGLDLGLRHFSVIVLPLDRRACPILR